MDTITKLKKLQQKAIEKDQFEELEKFLESDEYQALGYVQKNQGFVTSHKLLEFERCGFCYNKKFVELVPDPTEEENDAFLVGDAFDTLLSKGKEAFDKRFAVVTRRTGGSGLAELTPLQGQIISNMEKGFAANSLFIKDIKRRVVVIKISDILLKAEMDHCDDRVIMDIKTAANITRLDFYHYALQLAFYQWVYEERYGKRLDCYLNIVDKFKFFSRSRAVKFTDSTLMCERRRIIPLIDQMVDSEDTGLFFPAARQEVLDECPYYGIEGHGIPQQYIYV